jgi:hypothetical protein
MDQASLPTGTIGAEAATIPINAGAQQRREVIRQLYEQGWTVERLAQTLLSYGIPLITELCQEEGEREGGCVPVAEGTGAREAAVCQPRVPQQGITDQARKYAESGQGRVSKCDQHGVPW